MALFFRLRRALSIQVNTIRNMDSFASCPLCHLTLSQSQLQRHANSHFEGEEEEEEDEQFTRDLELAQQLALEESSHFATTTTTTTTTTAASSDEKVSCLIALQARSSCYQVKVESGGGLMALLRKCLELDTKNSCTSTVLLSGYVDHYQTLPSEDGGWGCGWRNIQMLSSYLLSCRPDAQQVLFGGSGFVPDIPYLQRWLEIAWENGFDTYGAQHFNHSLYGSKNWIGTTECAALFRSFGLWARIVDFGPNELKPHFLSVPGAHVSSPNVRIKRKAFQIYGPMDRYLTSRNHDVSQPDPSASDNTKCSTSPLAILLDWVWNYFSDGSSTASAHHSRVIVTDKAPLYFQHDGHSRTVVGIEVNHQLKGKLRYNLLILDPGHRTAALERSLKEYVGWKKLIKRGVHTLRKPQYQLCYIDPGLASREEIEKLKTIDSTFIEF
ncbi:conserved hypothetical protein [Ricinus communis]|uniref:UFSP1/2/DUB catalytic domain-containing protein n=1 Tax=Ricinus communis TaxID=3988 RepID=B9RPJ2_RICCO|nr:conserved hypothetical protein [Ricinus communis]